MSVDVTVVSEFCCSGHNQQFTYNYTPALRDAGFPGWDFIDGLDAWLVGRLIEKVQAKLNDLPNHYNGLIRGGGSWGNLDTLLKSLQNLREACATHPNAIVRAS